MDTSSSESKHFKKILPIKGRLLDRLRNEFMKEFSKNDSRTVENGASVTINNNIHQPKIPVRQIKPESPEKRIIIQNVENVQIDAIRTTSQGPARRISSFFHENVKVEAGAEMPLTNIEEIRDVNDATIPDFVANSPSTENGRSGPQNYSIRLLSARIPENGFNSAIPLNIMRTFKKPIPNLNKRYHRVNKFTSPEPVEAPGLDFSHNEVELASLVPDIEMKDDAMTTKTNENIVSNGIACTQTKRLNSDSEDDYKGFDKALSEREMEDLKRTLGLWRNALRAEISNKSASAETSKSGEKEGSTNKMKFSPARDLAQQQSHTENLPAETTKSTSNNSSQSQVKEVLVVKKRNVKPKPKLTTRRNIKSQAKLTLSDSPEVALTLTKRDDHEIKVEPVSIKSSPPKTPHHNNTATLISSPHRKLSTPLTLSQESPTSFRVQEQNEIGNKEVIIDPVKPSRKPTSNVPPSPKEQSANVKAKENVSPALPKTDSEQCMTSAPSTSKDLPKCKAEQSDSGRLYGWQDDILAVIGTKRINEIDEMLKAIPDLVTGNDIETENVELRLIIRHLLRVFKLKTVSETLGSSTPMNAAEELSDDYDDFPADDRFNDDSPGSPKSLDSATDDSMDMLAFEGDDHKDTSDCAAGPSDNLLTIPNDNLPTITNDNIFETAQIQKVNAPEVAKPFENDSNLNNVIIEEKNEITEVPETMKDSKSDHEAPTVTRKRRICAIPSSGPPDMKRLKPRKPWNLLLEGDRRKSLRNSSRESSTERATPAAKGAQAAEQKPALDKKSKSRNSLIDGTERRNSLRSSSCDSGSDRKKKLSSGSKK